MLYLQKADGIQPPLQNSDSILNYVVGEVSREAGGARPEYLPYGYLVGDTTSIVLNLVSTLNALLFTCSSNMTIDIFPAEEERGLVGL